MRMSDFYRILGNTFRGRWKLDRDGYLRVERKKGCNVCPVTAVCGKVTGKYFEEADYRKAAKVIGLRQREADRVANAADNKTKGSRVRNMLVKTVIKRK